MQKSVRDFNRIKLQNANKNYKTKKEQLNFIVKTIRNTLTLLHIRIHMYVLYNLTVLRPSLFFFDNLFNYKFIKNICLSHYIHQLDIKLFIWC